MAPVDRRGRVVDGGRRAPARSRTRSRRSRRRARARTRTRRAAARADRRARAPARAGRRTSAASVAARARRRRRRVRARLAPSSSATGSKSMRWHRDRIVGSRSSGAAVTSTTTVCGPAAPRASSTSRWPTRSGCRAVVRPRTARAPCARLRSAPARPRGGCGRGRPPSRGTTRRSARTRRRRDARRACTSRWPRSSSPTPIEHRRELVAPRPRPPTRAARRAGTRARGASAACRNAVDRPFLTDDHRRPSVGETREQTAASGAPARGRATSSGVPDRARRRSSPAPGASSRYAARTRAWNSAPARSNRSRRPATRPSATSSARSSTITDVGLDTAAWPTCSGARPPRHPSPRATPWYASVDGSNRSHTTIAPRCERGPDHLRDVLGPVGEHEHRAPRADRAASSACSSTARSSAPVVRVARLVRHDDLAARVAQDVRRAARPASTFRRLRRPRRTMNRHVARSWRRPVERVAPCACDGARRCPTGS